MEFLTPGQKLKEMRKRLKMTQKDLQIDYISRGLISMIEIGERTLTKDTAIKLADKFRQKAEELNIYLYIDENFLLRSPSEDAELYCLEKIKKSKIDDDIEGIYEIACQFNLLKVKAAFYSKKADYCLDKKDYDAAFHYYNEALAICRDSKQDDMISYLYWKMGFCKAETFQYKDALSYFYFCEHYSIIYKDKKIQQAILYDKALIYKKINKFESALESIEKYLLSNLKEDDMYFYANILKANCYESMKKYDTAIEIYNCLLTKLSKHEKPLIGYIYNNLAVIYLDKSDFKISLKHFDMAEKIRNSADKHNVCHTLIDKSEVFFKQHLYEEAVSAINSGLKDAEVYKDYEYLLKGNYNLLHIYEAMNDISNFKKTYLTIIDLLKESKNSSKLTLIYVKLALLYLNENDIENAKQCLIMSQNLTV